MAKSASTQKKRRGERDVAWRKCGNNNSSSEWLCEHELKQIFPPTLSPIAIHSSRMLKLQRKIKDLAWYFIVCVIYVLTLLLCFSFCFLSALLFCVRTCSHELVTLQYHAQFAWAAVEREKLCRLKTKSRLAEEGKKARKVFLPRNFSFWTSSSQGLLSCSLSRDGSGDLISIIVIRNSSSRNSIIVFVV